MLYSFVTILYCNGACAGNSATVTSTVTYYTIIDASCALLAQEIGVKLQRQGLFGRSCGETRHIWSGSAVWGGFHLRS